MVSRLSHNRIITKRGVVHDLITDFDKSGRVIVATRHDVAVYESQIAYEDETKMPLCAASILGVIIDDEMEQGYVHSIENGEQHLAVIHTLGCTLHVSKVQTA